MQFEFKVFLQDKAGADKANPGALLLHFVPWNRSPTESLASEQHPNAAQLISSVPLLCPLHKLLCHAALFQVCLLPLSKKQL